MSDEYPIQEQDGYYPTATPVESVTETETLQDDEEEAVANTDEDEMPLSELAERDWYRQTNHYVDVWSTSPAYQHTADDLANLYSKPQFYLEHAESVSTPFSTRHAYNCDFQHYTNEHAGNCDAGNCDLVHYADAQDEQEQEHPVYITSYDSTDDSAVEFYMPSHLARLSPHIPEGMTIDEDQFLIFTLKQSTEDPEDVEFTAVINRECNNLSADDILLHATEVNKAKLEELKRWHDMKCFKRTKRHSARNNVDGKWVIKWKKVKQTVSGKEIWTKVIKARLTARGFKDVQAFSEDHQTYSGTASKWGQREINITAANTGHKLFSMDISAAFLKGMTFKEIAACTGEPLRNVQFEVPPKDAWLVQQLPGMADFDHQSEVLDLIKALWGLKDAPRAFSLRLQKTLKQLGYVQGIMDPQIWRLYQSNSNSAQSVVRELLTAEDNRVNTRSDFPAEADIKITGAGLRCILTTHIDDIKGAGEDTAKNDLLRALKHDYGSDVKLEETFFDHCGIRHTQYPNGEIWTDQAHYITEISVIPTNHLDMKQTEQELDTADYGLFRSLLGALMWLLQTRADIAPFIGYLQRGAHKPTRQHLQQANKVLRHLKNQPKVGIMYRKLQGPLRMVVAADSAYKSTEDEAGCLALKGYLIMLVGSDKTSSQFPGGKCCVLEWVSRKFATVTRSSFAAELRNQLEAAQASIYFAAALQENLIENITTTKLTRIIDQGRLSLPIYLAGDNKGVLTSVRSENPSAKAEPVLTPHVKALRELVDRGIIRLVWVDNRDMVADPLTKGKTKRNSLNFTMSQGAWIINECVDIWPKESSSLSRASCNQSQVTQQ